MLKLWVFSWYRPTSGEWCAVMTTNQKETEESRSAMLSMNYACGPITIIEIPLPQDEVSRG